MKMEHRSQTSLKPGQNENGTVISQTSLNPGQPEQYHANQKVHRTEQRI